ncbi:MAG: cupin domain-containing protein [Myxococcota bacterium]
MPLRLFGFSGLWMTLALLSACAPGRDPAERRHEPVILSPTEGVAIPFPGHPTRRLATADSNQAGLSLFEIVIPASSAGAPPHIHTHEDEFFYVRAGTPTFMANGERKTIGPGGFILLPRDSLHAVWNRADQEAILLIGTSRGQFDDFFDAVALEARQSKARTPEEIGQIMFRLGAERGVTIRMDQVPRDVADLYGLPGGAADVP